MITGRPGVGKTTLIMRLVERVKGLVTVHGFVTLEVREGGSRVGFRIMDVETNEQDWLAHVRLFAGGPRVGRYNVNLDAINRIALPALNRARPGDLVIIDELGPMELMSGDLIPSVRGVLGVCDVVATVHRGYVKDPVLARIIDDYGIEVLELTVENRDALLEDLVNKVRTSVRLRQYGG